MVTVTFAVFSEVHQALLDLLAISLLLLSGFVSSRLFVFSSPLLASLASLTPSFSTAPLSVSVICFSHPLPVVG